MTDDPNSAGAPKDGNDPASHDDKSDNDGRNARASQPDGDGKDPGDNGDADDKPKKKLSGRAKIILLVIAIVVVVAIAIWFTHYETRGKYVQSTDDAYIKADAVTVAPKVNGYVAEVLVADNQDVKAGQPLIRIDARDYQAQADQARAQIAQAQASADSARASIREQYATITQTRAQLASNEVKAGYDAAEVRRYAPLAVSGAETRSQLAQLSSTAGQSRENARATAAQVVMQQRRIGTYQAQIREAQAQAQGARAQLAAANVDVGATLIRAAMDGRIGDKTVTIGQYAQAGTRLMSLVPVTKLYVTANFKETQLGLMRVGQPATIEVDALGGIELRGRVESVSPGTGAQFSLIPPSNATGNFTKIVQRVPVRISIEATPDARKLLVPGLSVKVAVDTIGAKGDLDHIEDEQKRLDKRN
ncbi:HlyD family secretion protein [Sphingomonas nostoxanthinifaciens]|uniref:HlyD family secretion protein n=1 Tax=Sphingomonas nostoxanthinifaciens TaxID=2872652 RepID=UPI001CC1C361|nr:HlyD family secretion protein [Sphingomonas nostoxanthinifaciens]UAK23107.1 HlyD family secretion protein [Sphingomonas nostoxanthinifaciens]